MICAGKGRNLQLVVHYVVGLHVTDQRATLKFRSDAKNGILKRGVGGGDDV